MANAKSTAVTLYTRKGVAFIIDARCRSAVERHSWSLDSHGYLHTNVGKHITAVFGRKGKGMTLHQFLFGYAPSGLEWDHRNRNPLDNRRANLRLLTHRENTHNSGARSNSQSGVKGVHPHRYVSGLVWRATLNHKHLGCFKTLEEAAAVRRRAEREQAW